MHLYVCQLYMAPEMLLYDKATLTSHPYACDVYSYAILAWQVVVSDTFLASFLMADFQMDYYCTHLDNCEGIAILHPVCLILFGSMLLTAYMHFTSMLGTNRIAQYLTLLCYLCYLW